MFTWLLDTYQLLLAAVGVAGVLAACVKWSAPKIRRATSTYKTVQEISAKLPLLEESHVILQRIDRYVTPNGGSSLFDKVDDIQRTVLRTGQRLRSYIDLNTSAAVFEADENGSCTFVNREWCDLTGLLPFQAYGTGWTLGVHPDDREQVRKAWKEAVSERHEFDMRFRYYDQTTQAATPVRCRAVPWYNGADVIGWTVSAKKTAPCAEETK